MENDDRKQTDHKHWMGSQIRLIENYNYFIYLSSKWFVKEEYGI